MATEAQRLVQKRSSLLRDLAGCRAQLSRISRATQELSPTVMYPDLDWIRYTVTQLVTLDQELRVEFNMRPIQTYEQWQAEFLAKHARKMNKLAKNFPKIPTEPNHEPT